ncbi:unnamed protein product [Choristocarpus tenellus]
MNDRNKNEEMAPLQGHEHVAEPIKRSALGDPVEDDSGHITQSPSEDSVKEMSNGAIEVNYPEDDEGRPFPGRPHPLRRTRARKDLWQSQGAYRSNFRSMQTIFDEFYRDVEQNKGLDKAKIKDIFTYTTTGYKHLVTEAPSEDRIAVHQAVVPKIADDTRKDLGINEIDQTPFALFGVFDGHGGTACAEFLTDSVAEVMAHSPVLYDEDLKPFERRACATCDTFAELEKVHNEWAQQSGDLSGSTALLSTFQDGVLVMAGVGDSAGLYVDHAGKMRTLCPQHSTQNEREVERVIAMGGTIINNRVAGVLMPTRTLGDLDCKMSLGDIVSPHPELTLAAIYAPPQSEDGSARNEPFVVLASDGLWDVMTNADVAQLVLKGIRKLREKEEKEASHGKLAVRASTIMNSEESLSLFPEVALPPSRQASWMRKRQNSGLGRFFKGKGKSSKSNMSNSDFMDRSRNGAGLDASVRRGKHSGKFPSASLDVSKYGGRAAMTSSDTDARDDGGNRLDDCSGPKSVAVTGNDVTAGVRTAGEAKDNVAMHLVREAIRINSRDDISVVVITFEGSLDKSPPGSGKPRKGSVETPRPPGPRGSGINKITANSSREEDGLGWVQTH